MPKETRNCRNCGAPFVVFPCSIKRNCSHKCSMESRTSTHRLIFTSEYSAWRDMKARCYRTTHKNYPQYGGRGISVCERWRTSFPNFYADMGPKPDPRLSIERKDNDGNYEPSNCKWADKAEQSRNRRGSWTADQDQLLRDLTAQGCTFPDAAKTIGKSVKAVQGRAATLRIRSGKPCNSGSYAT